MMTKANETPAIDSVRIFVSRPGQRVPTQRRSGDAPPTGRAPTQPDAAKQAQAEQQQAGAQKPDQDGAVQPLPAGVGTAADGAAAPDRRADEPRRPRPRPRRPRPPTDGPPRA